MFKRNMDRGNWVLSLRLNLRRVRASKSERTGVQERDDGPRDSLSWRGCVRALANTG